jgi:hypothetical protein
MPSLESRLARMLVRLCVWVGATVLLAGCHYTEQEKWSVCCVLYVQRDAEPMPTGRATIVNWYRHVVFDSGGQGGQGPYGEGRTFYSNKDDKIRSEVADFLADSPGSRAVDYFIHLGMTCGPAPTSSKGIVTRCQVELPVSVRCGPTYQFLPGTTPIPEQMQKPFPALLQTSVNLSADTVLTTTSRVDPVPGGHLCHR